MIISGGRMNLLEKGKALNMEAKGKQRGWGGGGGDHGVVKKKEFKELNKKMI
jgi:hypothetical protein